MADPARIEVKIAPQGSSAMESKTPSDGSVASRQSKNAAAVTKRRELELKDLGELLQRPDVPVDWLVEGRLVAGSVSMFASKPKVGKSTIVRHLALCVARGEPFLGWEVKRGSVIYLNLEEREEDVVSAFRAMGATGDDPIKITNRADVAALTATLRKDRHALLIVDPLFRLIPVRDEKAYAEVYAHMGPLIDVARETGTHITCLHHSPKKAREDAIDAPLGSTALGGAVSTLFVLSRNPESGIRSIRSTQRVGSDLPEMVLRFDIDTQRVELVGTRQQFEVNNLKPMICNALGELEMTEEQIFAAVEHGKTGAKRVALRSLCSEGSLERLGAGKKGDPYLYRKARFHVPALSENSGNENSETDTLQEKKMLVPNTSFLCRNEETRIVDDQNSHQNSSKMLVPDKPENLLIRNSRERAFYGPSDPPASDENPVKPGYREIVL